MRQLHLKATLSSLIKTCTENFTVSYPKYGSGTLELATWGEYRLTTNGITDGSARRTSAYKTAYAKITMDMLHAYEAEDRQYTSIHRQMPTVQTISTYQEELQHLAPQKYHCTLLFTLPKPTPHNLELELEKEVYSLNFGKTAKEELIDKQSYIKSRLSALIQTRQSLWQEASDLFHRIEKAKEEKANANYLEEYKILYQKKQAFIEGKDAAVADGLKTMCETISIPSSLDLHYDYIQQSHLLNVNLVLTNGIHLPTSKATLLSSGKISIKNKLVKEMIADKTKSVLSLVYYLAAHLLNVSPNIHYLRLSLYEKNLQSPLLWVEFDRNQFANKSSQTLDVISDILSHPHVLHYKTKGDAVELSPIDPTLFDRELVQAIQIANLSHPQAKSQGSAYAI